MSHPSSDTSSNRPGHSAGVNDLQTSNQTSGHFLGTVPRNWMLHGGSAHLVAANPNTNIALQTRRSTTLPNPPTENLNVQDTIPQQPPEWQSLPAIEVIGTGAERPILLPSQSDGNERFKTAFPPGTDANRNSFSSNQGGTQFAIHQPALPALIPTPNASPIDQESACAGTAQTNRSFLSSVNSHPLRDAASASAAAYNANGNVEAGGYIDLTEILASRPTTTSPSSISPYIPQLSTPNMSPALAVVSSNMIPASRPPGQPPGPSFSQSPLFSPNVPAKRPRGRPPGPRIPPSPMAAPISVWQAARTPQILAGAASLPSQAAKSADPNLSRRLNEAKENAAKYGMLSAVDVIRFTWLQSACRIGDHAYILLHQLTCISTQHPTLLHTTLDFSLEHLKTLDLVSFILADNRQLSPSVSTYFCNFPWQLPAFTSDRSPNFIAWINSIKPFLETLARQWQPLRDQVVACTCPPSARELADVLGLTSSILSQAIYTHLFYELFPRCTPSFIAAGFKLFTWGQDKLTNRTNPGMTNTSQSAAEHQAFRSEFYRLVRTLYQPTHQLPLVPAPGMNSNAAVRNHTLSRQPSTTITVSATGNQNLSSPRGNAANTSSSHNSGAASTRLLPLTGRLLPIVVNPTPNRNALHQAHLFDSSITFDRHEEDLQSDGRLYSFLERLIGDLHYVSTTTVFQTWSVTVPLEILERRVRDSSMGKQQGFGRSTKSGYSTSVMLYLRCIHLKTEIDSLSEVEYSAEATYWPQHIFISINGVHLEFRRKIHYGRDLPVDITNLLKHELNELKLSYHPSQSDIKMDKKFAIGLEVEVILDHDTVFHMPKTLEAEKSREAIIEQVQCSSIEDDIVMTDTNISIDLIDPVTARIFENPVRGVSCRHRECFDLEAFLQSRGCRNKDNFVHTDEWKCPICGKDARPSSLIVDEFLLQVKQKLLAENRPDTKAILVREDGTWMPKVDTTSHSTNKRSGVSTEARHSNELEAAMDAKNDNNLSSADRQGAATATQSQIIVLDDDDD